MRTIKTIALIALATSAGAPTAKAHYTLYFFAQEENTQIKQIAFNSSLGYTVVSSLDADGLVNRAKTTAIIIPKRWQNLTSIDARSITNLTRIVIEFQTERTLTIHVQGTKMDEGEIIHTAGMQVKVEDDGFLGPIRRIRIDPNNPDDMAKPEAKHFKQPMIRAYQSAWGTPRTEITWKLGILQISADNMHWEDLPIEINTLPDRTDLEYRRILRWPQFVANHEKQFFRIKPEEAEEPNEESQ